MQAEILQRTLVAAGYQVAVAENGAEALAIIRQAKPSLIISDIVMPVMDGCQMCHEIKHDEDLKDIPVILLTDLADTRDVILRAWMPGRTTTLPNPMTTNSCWAELQR